MSNNSPQEHKNTDWKDFLARRAQTRERLNKEQKSNIIDNKQCITESIVFDKKCSLQTTQIEFGSDDTSSDSSPKSNHFKDLKQSKIHWIDLYEDAICHIASFCTLFDLEQIIQSCKSWHHFISFYDSSKWRIWYNAIHYELKCVKSLDRTGTSNHFIVVQNNFDSFDSVYHFAKFARFSLHLLTRTRQNIKNPFDSMLFDELSKINLHSPSVIDLFVCCLHKKILFEWKQKSENDEEISKNSNGSSANPELLYIHSYDTASGTDTDTEHYGITEQDDEDSDFIIIDDREYKQNDKDIVMIRQNIANIMKIYQFFGYCVKRKAYLKLLHLFENIILIQSRPILRWFLFLLDRSQCFVVPKKSDKSKGDISDITVFLKRLEKYLRDIHCVINNKKMTLNMEKNGDKKLLKYLNSHQTYLLKMVVDIDELRSRGVSSLEYWMASGTMICNPDL